MVQELVLIAGIAVLGGLVKGLTGFGYALISTGLLASIYPPETAVALMILPLIASNLEVAGELSRKELIKCVDEFRYYLASLMAGAVAGTSAAGLISARLFSAGIGLLVISYSVYRFFQQDINTYLPSKDFLGGKGAETATGLVSGILFGLSNVGVQVVAYIESRDLERSSFLGMIGISMLGVSAVRLLTAGYLGFFRGFSDVYLSVFMAVAGLGATYVGQRTAERLDPQRIHVATLVLLGIIGVRLLTKSLGIV